MTSAIHAHAQHHPARVPASTSVSALLTAFDSQPRLSSSCPSLDALLTPSNPTNTAATTNGLSHSALLELVGPPGSGKTRVCLGFALASRFNAISQHQPQQGQVLVFDAEGSLLPTLLKDSAELFADHHGHASGAAQLACDGIHYRRVYDISLLIANLYALPKWLEEHREVRLIILDSLSCHLTPTALDRKTRGFVYSVIKSTLEVVTAQYNVSVIVTTYTSLKLFSPDGHPTGFTLDAEALLTPQLAESWIPQSVKSQRVVLYFDEDGERLAHLLSSTVNTRAAKAAFTIDALGPCDHPPVSLK
ncbi:hypothetical protein OIO90_002988 [Microbotryomycetes sp. JL221]|nr:hypothetical protein OIO90_002988 [Microbotryomycetes sp. JL221]